MESSRERGNETSGSIKCRELQSSCTICGLSSGTQLHRVSLTLSPLIVIMIANKTNKNIEFS
jgi:hypothetical protein